MDRLAAGGLTYTDFHTTRALLAVAGRDPRRAQPPLDRLRQPRRERHGLPRLQRHRAAPGRERRQGPAAAGLHHLLHSASGTTCRRGRSRPAAPSSAGRAATASTTSTVSSRPTSTTSCRSCTRTTGRSTHRLGKPDYHISTDMADRAIYWITAQKSVTPDRPFMMQWAPGANARPAPRSARRTCRQVPRQVRHGLGRGARADPEEPDRQGHLPGGHEALRTPQRHSGLGLAQRPRRRRCTRARWRRSRPSSSTWTTRSAA